MRSLQPTSRHILGRKPGWDFFVWSFDFVSLQRGVKSGWCRDLCLSKVVFGVGLMELWVFAQLICVAMAWNVLL